MRVPSPLGILLIGVAIAAALTWIVPAGEYQRREDAATGRSVVLPGTYAPVAARPVGPFAALVAIPRGFVEAADVVATILFVGGAWVVLDRLGTLGRVVARFVGLMGRRRGLTVVIVAAAFSFMGALENMQEEIIPLVPVLLVLGRRIGVDAVTVVAMSAGAAMVGSAFGPTNPFQAGIALRLAELPPLVAIGLRTSLWVATSAVWIGWTLRRARKTMSAGDALAKAEPRKGHTGSAPDVPGAGALAPSDLASMAALILPMAAYVYGAAMWDWGFNELSAGFLLGGMAAGLLGGFSLTKTCDVFLEGMKGLVSAAVLVGVARSISLILADGHVVDTILRSLAAPLVDAPPAVAAFLMVPFHALVHVPVSSVSGHAVLTMPLLVPLADVLDLSRLAVVMAYQIGAGLTELVTPTNGAMMAIVTAAGVSYGEWARFAVRGVGLTALVGLAALFAAR